jgi:hypothetical protein
MDAKLTELTINAAISHFNDHGKYINLNETFIRDYIEYFKTHYETAHSIVNKTVEFVKKSGYGDLYVQKHGFKITSKTLYEFSDLLLDFLNHEVYERNVARYVIEVTNSSIPSKHIVVAAFIFFNSFAMRGFHKCYARWVETSAFKYIVSYWNTMPLFSHHLNTITGNDYLDLDPEWIAWKGKTDTQYIAEFMTSWKAENENLFKRRLNALDVYSKEIDKELEKGRFHGGRPSTKKSRKLRTGPKGGRYYIKSGRKVYVRT